LRYYYSVLAKKYKNMSTSDNFNPIKNKSNKNRWFGWISPQHRLVVVNDENFKEERSLKLTWRNVLIIAVVMLGIWLLSMMLMLRLFGGKSGSPIAAEIANYTPEDVRNQLITIHGQLDSLETELVTRDIYIEKIQSLLNNNLESEKDVKAKRSQLAEIQANDTTTRKRRGEMPEKNEAVKNMVMTAPYENEVSNANGALSSSDFDDNVRLDQLAFVSPLRGIISDTFSAKSKHYGIDVVAPKGSVIKAMQSGTVVVSTWSADTGHMLAIQHPNNVVSFYKHNSSLLKKMGDKVNAGEAIAIIGNTGEQTDGPHLHFEIWFHGQPVNPQQYVQF
jgi:murein DD-endopeptidase MepM/ murein hydrolase activator NlpD